MRHDERRLREREREPRYRERVAEAQVEAAWQTQFSTHAHGKNAAVHEYHRTWNCRRGLGDAKRPVVVQRNVVHRRKETEPSQSQRRKRAVCACGGVARCGIEHEKANQAGRVPRDGGRHRFFIARHAGDQRGALNTFRVQFVYPAIRQRLRGSWILPLELAIQVLRG